MPPCRAVSRLCHGAHRHAVRFTGLILNGGTMLRIVGGIVVACSWSYFIAFPLYLLHDGRVVRRPLWNRPVELIQEPQVTPRGLPPDGRTDDPLQRLAKHLVEYRPAPNWLGFREFHPIRAKKPTGRNSALILAGLTTVFYFALLNRRSGHPSSRRQRQTTPAD